MTLTMIFILIDNHKWLSALLLLTIVVLIMVLTPLMNKLLGKNKETSL